ncbi:MAG: thioredoxin domain-containing protein [Actinobacteria bacterium]|nr:thioredoxin domain-containing protein [Actinomycetota bacterium]
MTAEQEPSGNRLADEASSYLKRQADQPVEWFGWSEEAFERAAALVRPVLISVNCGLCHSCARMDDESFRDERVASYLNEHFVCVKVDAVLRPDVERHFAPVLAALSGELAHPQTLFTDARGMAFYGGSFFPAVGNKEIPAFSSILKEVVRLWEQERREVLGSASQLVDHLKVQDQPLAEVESVTPGFLQRGVFALQAAFDEEYGGFGQAPKAPMPTAIDFMLRVASRGVPRAKLVAETTLKQMALGGTYDHVGGGFHRLSVDREWSVPRFEKLLGLNALLARTYLRAWQLNDAPLNKQVALDTCEFLLRDLADPGGAFCEGLGAVSEGREGDYYTWSLVELEDAVEGAGALFGASERGNFSGRNVLHATEEEVPGPVKAALLKARSERTPPARDDQVVSAHNGLAIGALAEIGAALDLPHLVEAARRAASFLLSRHWDAGQQRLLRSGDHRGAKAPALLEDYAFVAEGLFTLWETTFETEWAQHCEQLCRQILDRFWDPEVPGPFANSESDGVIPRHKERFDGELISGYAAACSVLQKLGVLTGNSMYERKAAEALNATTAHLEGQFVESAGMLAAMDFLLSGTTEVAIAGDLADRATRRLCAAVWRSFEPNKVVAGGSPRVHFPMLQGKGRVDGQPAAHVRQGSLIKSPVSDPAAIPAALRFWPPPTDRQVRKVTDLISNALQRRHFFDNLQNPAWVVPLQEAGMFRAPPEPVFDFVEGTISSPPWPESQYLARMASLNPQEVAQVALSIPKTNNVLVHEDLADAALALPGDLAAKFVPRAREWLKSPYLLHLPEKLGELVTHLARGGRTTEALELAAVLLELEPLDSTSVRHADWAPPEPRARFGKYQYEQILSEQLTLLVSADPMGTLNLLADVLESAIDLSIEPGQQEHPRDFSHLWRPAIHPHEQNVDKTLRDPLVTALVDTAEQIAREEPEAVPELVKTLENRGWLIFQRVALHILRVWPDQAENLIEPRMVDRHLFHDPHLHHEYLLLAQDHFDRLPDEQQAMVLDWVGEGPDLKTWESDPELSEAYSTGEGSQTYERRWILKRLHLLSDWLSGEHLKRYEELSAEAGRPDNAEFVSAVTQTRADPTTPLQAEELHELDVAEIVSFARSFQPTPGLGNPTVEGLARKLSAVTASEPVRFALGAASFVGEDPIYVWAVVRGLQEAAEGTAFEWEPVLELCRWAVSVKPGAQAARWRPARLEIARLLSRGLAQGPAQIPDVYRQAAWNVIRPLTDDPDPSEGPAAGAVDASVRSSSSVRGEAMHAVVRYALWVRRQIESSPNARERMSRGLHEIPEVLEVLESHLDPDKDPEAAIRAVYGRWFAWMLMLDPNWGNSKLRQVFPTDPKLEYLRDAAWEGHISFCPPYDYLLDVLGEDYERAVTLIDRFNERPANVPTPESRLAEHLMVFYLRGRLALDRYGLLQQFFASAHPKLRRHALAFIGRSLQGQQGQQGKVPRDLLLRMRTLWERRLAAAKKARAPEDYADELSAFGWWFASGKLDDSWSLSQLSSVLEMGVKLDGAVPVVARLKELDESFAERAVNCLGMILSSEQDSTSLLALAEDARTILTNAMGSADQDVRNAAIELLRFFDVQELEELVRWD